MYNYRHRPLALSQSVSHRRELRATLDFVNVCLTRLSADMGVVVAQTITTIFSAGLPERRTLVERDYGSTAYGAETLAPPPCFVKKVEGRTETEVMLQSVSLLSKLLLISRLDCFGLHRSGPTSELVGQVEGHAEASCAQGMSESVNVSNSENR